MAYLNKAHASAKEEAQKPLHVVRVGHINAAIWENKTEYGSRYSVTLEQLYKDGDKDWQSSRSLFSSNLPIAEKALARAFDYISNLEEGGR